MPDSRYFTYIVASRSHTLEKMNSAWVDLSREWYDLEPADLKRAADRMDTLEATADLSTPVAAATFAQDDNAFGAI